MYEYDGNPRIPTVVMTPESNRIPPVVVMFRDVTVWLPPSVTIHVTVVPILKL